MLAAVTGWKLFDFVVGIFVLLKRGFAKKRDGEFYFVIFL